MVEKITDTVIEKIENMAYGYVFTVSDCLTRSNARNAKPE